ncbi:IBR domain protein [Penicillium argentinense]|uniref:RBR-type E3 ubiquitin transferase n=1 Tax=Penicillium argentinense TaxID=1131581 RepID=A0A9W9K233_9EURO|nr:IBR domain protein [Penicillium argentinense]KAJ5089821.1 IBR domain protein [Penicillium argentinense]
MIARTSPKDGATNRSTAARLSQMRMSSSPRANIFNQPDYVIDLTGSETEDASYGSDRPSSPPRIECVACGDLRFASEGVKAPCPHFYCKDCLTAFFESTLNDTSNFPPSCCGIMIPPTSATSVLSADLIRRTEHKLIEHEDTSPAYCADPACAQYIFPNNRVFNTGICRVCRKGTCLLCKKNSHPNDCLPESTDNQVLELAGKKGWKQCPNCGNVVELVSGCNHITCICKFHFCYICGAPWRSCECDRWDPEMHFQAMLHQVGCLDPEEMLEILHEWEVEL